MFGLWCRWSQIFSVFDRMQSRGAQRASAGFPDSSAPPAGPSSPVHSSVGTIPPDTSTCSPSADLGSPTEVRDYAHLHLSQTDEMCARVFVMCVCVCVCFRGIRHTPRTPATGETMTLEQKTCSISGASGKLSIWMQWMLPKLTLQLFSCEPRNNGTDHTHTHTHTLSLSYAHTQHTHTHTHTHTHHPLTHTHARTHSHAHPLTHMLARSLTHTHTHSHTHTRTHTLAHTHI